MSGIIEQIASSLFHEAYPQSKKGLPEALPSAGNNAHAWLRESFMARAAAVAAGFEVGHAVEYIESGRIEECSEEFAVYVSRPGSSVRHLVRLVSAWEVQS